MPRRPDDSMGTEVTERIGGEAARRALAAWVERGDPAPLGRWLGRILDAQGVPRQLPVGDWAPLLVALDDARRLRRAGWPEPLDALIEGLLQATFRMTRAGGGTLFTPPDTEPADGLPQALRRWAEHLAEPGLETVLDWWFPPGRGRGRGARSGVRASSRPRPTRHAAPPLPAWSSADCPLAMLRANWLATGDFIAIDHRRPGATTWLELNGSGSPWLGPTWVAEGRSASAAAAAERGTRPKPRRWVSNSSADLAEWAFRLGDLRLTRTALLLRGRRIALLADQIHGRAADPGAAMRVGLPPGVEAAPLDGGPAWFLSGRRSAPSAQVIPLALPRLATTRGHGTLTREGEGLRLCQPCSGRRTWLPLLVSWDPLRNRRAVQWRTLTVAEASRNCPPSTAFAARVSWGRDETLLVYRSLGPPALRSVLGHQTRASFLVALFGRDGDVTPILKLD